MMLRESKIFLSFMAYIHYFNAWLVEVYLHFTSLYPLHLFLRKLALANRKIRIIWAPINTKGRPPIDEETIKLILELKKLNPTWGGRKISDELAKIRYKVSKPTVLKYLEIYGLLNPPPNRGLSWTEFLGNHKFKIGIDFTSLITISGKQLFIFVILNIDTRELLGINITYRPYAGWVTQQFKNLFPDIDETPSLCICDRDTIFSGWFPVMMEDFFRISVKQTPYKQPWKNGRVERQHLSIKDEAFRNVTPINLKQAQRICNEYLDYHNNYRPHQGINSSIPSISNSYRPKDRLTFNKKNHLNGQIISFEPIAA